MLLVDVGHSGEHVARRPGVLRAVEEDLRPLRRLITDALILWRGVNGSTMSVATPFERLWSMTTFCIVASDGTLKPAQPIM